MTSFPKRHRALALLAPVALLLVACGDDATDTAEVADDAATVSFVQPADGDHVAGGLHLAMKADGITIEPAGDGAVHEGAGHFHVIADDGCVDPGAAVAKDADHVHFGKGQSEGTIYLAPGEHELCLQPGDGTHVALDPTDTITVTVGVTTQKEWCAVTKEVDDLFLSLDTGGEEFAIRKVGYENVRRLLAQLTAGIDQVDADARDDVGSTIADGSTIAGLFADAEDAAGAEAAMQAHFGTEGLQDESAGSTWILGACGVDIDD